MYFQSARNMLKKYDNFVSYGHDGVEYTNSNQYLYIIIGFLPQKHMNMEMDDDRTQNGQKRIKPNVQKEIIFALATKPFEQF